MNEAIAITEVIGRSEQGATRPFICRGDDWLPYYVKGRYAGTNSLCCEWVANRLFGLALPGGVLEQPEFRIAEVPKALIAGSARPDIRDLGAGFAFASLMIDDGQELSWSAAQAWPEETMALLLSLDLWLQNEDRTLTDLGGNPNLLVKRIAPWREQLWAYDFNLAFDPDFNRERFFGSHVFGGMLKRWPEGFRERMESSMRAALIEVPVIFGELPKEWLHLDGDESLPVQLEMERVVSLLELPFTDPETFWKLP